MSQWSPPIFSPYTLTAQNGQCWPSLPYGATHTYRVSANHVYIFSTMTPRHATAECLLVWTKLTRNKDSSVKMHVNDRVFHVFSEWNFWPIPSAFWSLMCTVILEGIWTLLSSNCELPVVEPSFVELHLNPWQCIYRPRREPRHDFATNNFGWNTMVDRVLFAMVVNVFFSLTNRQDISPWKNPTGCLEKTDFRFVWRVLNSAIKFDNREITCQDRRR